MSRHSIRDAHARRHERVEALLPWFVNRTLEAAERREVEEHLTDCDVCRRELEVERGVAEALRDGGEPAPAPHPRQLARLLERIDAGEATPAPAAPRWRGVAWKPWGGWGGGWRSVAALQAAAILALVGVLLARLDSAAPAPTTGYRTLADAPSPAAAAGDARPLRVQVIFSPSTTEGEMRELLDLVGAHIVGGPSPLGAYTLELRPTPDADPPQLVLGVLRASPAVRFAEPIVGAR